MGDRALRARTAPVNYSQSTPEKWQTPLRERAKERLKRKKTSDEAGGDKENTIFSFQVPEAQQAEPPAKKRGRPPKKQIAKGELVAKHATLEPELQVEVKVNADKGPGNVTKAKETSSVEEQNPEEDAPVQERPKQVSAGRKPINKVKLSKAVAAAVAAKRARATRSGEVDEAAGTRASGSGEEDKAASNKATRSGEEHKSESTRATRIGEKESKGAKKEEEGRRLKGKEARKAQQHVVVEIEGGEEAAPQKRRVVPSGELVPFIDASKAAAERQRELERGGPDDRLASFLKLQEAYEKLRAKYNEMKNSTLREAESLFEEQKRVVRIHGEAATKLVNHWKSMVDRLQEERATAVEKAKETKEIVVENAKLQIKLIEEEEKRVLLETQLQEMQAELQAAEQQTFKMQRPPPESRSVDVQVPSPTAKADWFTHAGVQTDELAVQGLPSPGTAVLDGMPTQQAVSTPVQPSQGFFEVRKEDLYLPKNGQGFDPSTEPEIACTEGDKVQDLEAGDLDVGDPEEENAWRELLMVLTGFNTVQIGDTKIRFSHEESEFSFVLTATPKDEDVTADMGRELDTLSRASSFFGERAEDCIFSYEPGAFGLLEDDLSEEHELRGVQTLTQQQVPRLIKTIMTYTLKYSRAK